MAFFPSEDARSEELLKALGPDAIIAQMRGIIHLIQMSSPQNQKDINSVKKNFYDIANQAFEAIQFGRATGG